MDKFVNPAWSVEEYMSATEELIKQMQYAMDYLKWSLVKYVDVSAIMSQLPLPQLPKKDYGDLVVLLNDEDYNDDRKEMQKFIKDAYKLRELHLRKGQQELEIVQMSQLTDYLTRAMPFTYPFAAEIFSMIRRYKDHRDRAFESYDKKLPL